ncbi:MAG: hypothetical protein KIT84_07855 [Labilithrix sp.]|nr:hypothetical protein [Labilithrix sp.]MCW5810911.1 hypothetical protein [Labilithrix sp.]
MLLVTASKTRHLLACVVLFCTASCAAPRKAPVQRPHVPVAPLLVVRDEHLTLRENAILELHAYLAAAARGDADGEAEVAPELATARAAYARAFAGDEDDARLDAATRALAACTTAECAKAALDRVATTPSDARNWENAGGTSEAGAARGDAPSLGAAFASAVPAFVARLWDERAAIAWTALERTHAAFDPRAAGTLLMLARDLAVTWPAASESATTGLVAAAPTNARSEAPTTNLAAAATVANGSATPSTNLAAAAAGANGSGTATVDLVAASPAAGRRGLLTPLLAARGACFAERRGESESVRNTRIVDCVLVRALLAGESSHRAALGARLWTLLVVHAVAATMSAFEPRHRSVDRRAVTAVEPALLEVVTRAWRPGPLSAEVVARLREQAAAPRPEGAATSPARTTAPPDNASR